MTKDCPSCTHTDTGVVDSRRTIFRAGPAVRRRRKCGSCGYKFTSYEVNELDLHALISSKSKQMESKIENAVIDRNFRRHASKIAQKILQEGM